MAACRSRWLQSVTATSACGCRDGCGSCAICDLPPLPKGTTLVDAHRIGDEVSFRVRLDEVRYDVDLARVRDAIIRGATVPLS